MANPRILIVDDEVPLLTVLSDSLKGMKTEYEIVTATDGLAALEHLEKGPFDLVVTDYGMTGMDGLELLESIRSIRPKTRNEDNNGKITHHYARSRSCGSYRNLYRVYPSGGWSG